MAIQDSNPERRNLIITSVAFIAYFYAGGSFPDSQVNLQVINAEFKHPEVLAVMAWLGFVWFFYRYWVTNHGKFTREFLSEISNFRSRKYISNYFEKKFGEHRSYGSKEGFEITSVGWEGLIFKVYYHEVHSGHLGEGFKGEFTDIKGWILALRATIECILQKPSFSSYVVPYLLAFIALFGVFIH